MESVHGTSGRRWLGAVLAVGLGLGACDRALVNPGSEAVPSFSTLRSASLTVVDLGILPDGTASRALGTNNRGQVVGFGAASSGLARAVLWTAVR